MIYDVIAGYLFEQIDLSTDNRIYLNTPFCGRFTNPYRFAGNEPGDEGGGSFINYGSLPSLAVVRDIEDNQWSENRPQYLLQISVFLREKLVPLSNRFDESLLFGPSGQKMDGNHTGTVEVLQVVNGVGDIVSPVHQLRFQNATVPMMAVPSPLELIFVSVVDTPLLAPVSGLASGPRILEDSVECGPGQVESRITIPSLIIQIRNVICVGCQSRDDPERLCISLETISMVQLLNGLADHFLPVVTERRMP